MFNRITLCSNPIRLTASLVAGESGSELQTLHCGDSLSEPAHWQIFLESDEPVVIIATDFVDGESHWTVASTGVPGESHIPVETLDTSEAEERLALSFRETGAACITTKSAHCAPPEMRSQPSDSFTDSIPAG